MTERASGLWILGCRLEARVFADGELERPRGFPEIGRDELFRFFPLTPAGIAFFARLHPNASGADPRRFRTRR